MEKSIWSFCGSLSSFCNHVESSCDALKQSSTPRINRNRRSQPPRFHDFRHRLFRRALRSLQWGLQEEPIRSHWTRTSPLGLWIQSRYNFTLNSCLIFSFWQIIYTKHLPMLILLLSFAIEAELDDEDEVRSISFFWFQGKGNDNSP